MSSVQSDRDYIEILKKEITDLKIHQERERKELDVAHRNDLYLYGYNVTGVSSIQSDRDYIEILKKEITDLKIHHERERKELDVAHRNDVVKLEDRLEADREEIRNKFKQEKVLQTVEFFKGGSNIPRKKGAQRKDFIMLGTSLNMNRLRKL